MSSGCTARPKPLECPHQVARVGAASLFADASACTKRVTTPAQPFRLLAQHCIHNRHACCTENRRRPNQLPEAPLDRAFARSMEACMRASFFAAFSAARASAPAAGRAACAPARTCGDCGEMCSGGVEATRVEVACMRARRAPHTGAGRRKSRVCRCLWLDRTTGDPTVCPLPYLLPYLLLDNPVTRIYVRVGSVR